MQSIRLCCLAVFCFLPLGFGCGSAKKDEILVKGKVHRKGEVLKVGNKVPGGHAVEVAFLPEGGGDPKSALADPNTGEFRLLNRGISAGKYKVAVYQYDPRPEDKLNGAFSAEKTPIVVEITGADQELDIDLSKYGKK